VDTTSSSSSVGCDSCVSFLVAKDGIASMSALLRQHAGTVIGASSPFLMAQTNPGILLFIRVLLLLVMATLPRSAAQPTVAPAAGQQPCVQYDNPNSDTVPMVSPREFV